MLKKFEVANFKGFKNKIVFDLSAHDYEFNQKIIKNGIVNKAIVYGKNNVGKSSLGIAIFDIISHLTDKERMDPKYTNNYINLENNFSNIDNVATFCYYFQFDNDIIVHEYKKLDIYNLVDEKITINNELVLYFNYFDRTNNYIDKDHIGDLNINLVDNKLSIVKYIYRNTPTNTFPLITKMMQYCESMLWYRSLSDGNRYCGYTNGGDILAEMLYKSGKIKEFENFLKENDVYYKLGFEEMNGKQQLMAYFENGRSALFESLASTGTKALFLFFVWSLDFDKISLLFIDEFDAFFHFEAAETIIKKLNEARGFQTILTSHNTYLMQNELTRPDCCYIMTNNKIDCLCDCTEKEIREAHNLEKMYINGAFNE